MRRQRQKCIRDRRHTIPTSRKTRATLSTASFLQAVRMAYIFARDSANVVRLQVVPGEADGVGRLIITATSAEHGDNVSELDVTVEGLSLIHISEPTRPY